MSETPTLTIDATLTERGQITVPSAIRQILGLSKGVVTFKGMPDGTVVIEPKMSEAGDPALAGFLALLEKDIASNPERLVAMTRELLRESETLVDGIDVDTGTPLNDD